MYSVTFACTTSPLCKPMADITEAIPDKEVEDFNNAVFDLLAHQLANSNLFPTELLQQVFVKIDGSYSGVVPKERMGAWGYYFRKDCLANNSGLCKYPPYTNNRAEMEALIHLLTDWLT